MIIRHALTYRASDRLTDYLANPPLRPTTEPRLPRPFVAQLPDREHTQPVHRPPDSLTPDTNRPMHSPVGHSFP